MPTETTFHQRLPDIRDMEPKDSLPKHSSTLKDSQYGSQDETPETDISKTDSAETETSKPKLFLDIEAAQAAQTAASEDLQEFRKAGQFEIQGIPRFKINRPLRFNEAMESGERQYSRSSKPTEPLADSTTSSRRSNFAYEADTGWSWVVLAAFFIIVVMLVGFVRSYGLFFVEMQDRYKTSATAISLVGSFWSACFSLTAVFVMTFLVDVMSERQCVFLGMTLITAGSAFSCLMTSFPFYLLTLGALVGIGSGFAYGPGFVLLGKYFRKHLTLATAIANTGVSFGVLIVPIVIHLLLDHLAFPTVMLATAAVLGQTLVCACLMRPARRSEKAEGWADDGRDNDSGFEDGRRRTEEEDMKFKNVGEVAEGVSGISKEEFINKVQIDLQAGLDGLNMDDKTDEYGLIKDGMKNEDCNDIINNKVDLMGEEECDMNNPKDEDISLLKREDVVTSDDDYDKIEYADETHTDYDSGVNNRKEIETEVNPDDEIQEFDGDFYLQPPKDDLMILGSLGEGPGHMLMTALTEDPSGSAAEEGSLVSDVVTVVEEDKMDEAEARDMLLDMFENQMEPRLTRTYSDSIQVVHSTLAPTLPLSCSLQHVSADIDSPTQQLLQESFLDKLATFNIVEFVSVPDLLSVSMPSLHHMRMRSRRVKIYRRRNQTRPGMCTICCARLAKIFNFSIFRNIIFSVLMIVQFLGVQAGNLIPIYLPPLAREKTLSDTEGALLLTLIGALDIFSRMLPGVLSHFKLMKPNHITMLSLVILGTACQFTGFYNTFPALLGFAALVGVLSGIFFSMTQSVAIQFLGLKRFPVTFGFVMLTNGVSLAVGYPIMGVLKDITGTYVTSFHFIGATQIMAAVLLSLLPLLTRLQN